MRILKHTKKITNYGAEGIEVTVVEQETEVGAVAKSNVDIKLYKEDSGATIYLYSLEQVEAVIALLQEALGQVRGK